MDLPPFTLDHWLAAHEFADPPIRFNLASSTGPRWTLGDIHALDGGAMADELAALQLGYVPPEGSRPLREAIGAFAGVDPDWVVVTTGASEALSILFCLAAAPGARMVTQAPGFPGFDAMAAAWGLAVDSCILDRADGFAQTAAATLRHAGTGTALVLVNSPHNPCGSVMARVEIETLAAALAGRGVPLVVDEVYHPLYFDTRSSNAAAESAASIANVVVVGDMSKALSLPGLRIGWIIDADAERRTRIIDARSYFTICGSPLLEAIAVTAFRHREAILSRLQAVAAANLGELDAFMRGHADTLAWVKPAGGTVAFPWFRDGRDSRPWCEACARAGVLFAPGDCFGAPDHIRIGFGAAAEGFAEALAIASAALAPAERAHR